MGPIRAEFWLKAALLAMEKAKGGSDRKSEEYHRSRETTGDRVPLPPVRTLPDGRPWYADIDCKTGKPSKTLHDLGMSKQQSSDWQRVAVAPEREFEESST